MPSDPESKFCVTSRTIRPTDSDRAIKIPPTQSMERLGAPAPNFLGYAARHSRRATSLQRDLLLLGAISPARDDARRNTPCASS